MSSSKKTYRISSSNFSVLELDKNSWKKSKVKFPNTREIIKSFKSNHNIKKLIDSKNPEFLKGQLSSGKVTGARIDILPNGEKLNKAYSLFSPNLKIHDEKSNSHWDVIYQNPNGQFTYLYTLNKDKLSKKQKYKKVEEFARCLPKLKSSLSTALKKDPIALPMLILLKTKIRVGSEIYYKKNHHKGLTTLKKKDIKISGDKICINFIAKDGVPMEIIESFPTNVIKQITKLLKIKHRHDFIFTNASGHPFSDVDFEKAFEKYCGKKFYPHIIRSHYATEEAKKFLISHKKFSEEKVKNLYIKIAEKLGHKKFSKKKDNWEENYQVALHYYISPEIVRKITKTISD